MTTNLFRNKTGERNAMLQLTFELQITSRQKVTCLPAYLPHLSRLQMKCDGTR
jgi:hypothetical protein